MSSLTPLTEEQLALLTEQTERASRKSAIHAVRQYRNRALVGFCILLFGIGGVVLDNRHQSEVARGVLCTIIKRGDVQAYAYEREGTITRAQLDRALAESARSRELLAPGKNCDSSITPAPPVAKPGPAAPPVPKG